MGIGFPLYFYYKKFTIILFLLWIILVSIPVIWINNTANDPDDGVGQLVDDSSPIFLVHATLGNHGSNNDEYHKTPRIDAIITLNTIFIWILIFAFLWFDKFQINFENKQDEDDITASDFTVMISNLPYDIKPVELKEWLLDQHKCNDILHIVFWYNIRAIVQKTNRLLKLREIKSYLLMKQAIDNAPEEHKTQQGRINLGRLDDEFHKIVKKTLFWFERSLPKLEEVEERIHEIKQEIEVLKAKIMSDDSKEGKFWGRAFVTFKSQNEVDRLVEHFYFSMYKRFTFYILFKLLKWK